MTAPQSTRASSGPVPSATSPLRVALVGPSLDILGGQAIILDRLRRRLETVDGLDVSFVPVNPRLPGVLGLTQRVKYLRTVVTTIAYVWSLLGALRRVDVVHAFSASYWSFLLAPLPAMLVGRLWGKTVVLNYRSGEADDHLANWRTAVLGMRLAHAIVVPSGYLVDVFAKYGLQASAVANFVEAENIHFRARSELAPRFLSNRNLEPLYNVGCVIRAFARIQHEVPEAELVVAGDGSQRGELEALVVELGVRNVSFVGRVTPREMPAAYAEADVYLNSPDIDNMPNSIIEAFAAGLPVVSTDAGGIPYVVRHEENGLLVPCGDDAAMSAQALRLLGDPALASRLSRQGREECVARYTWPSVREQWLQLYRRHASERAGGAARAESA